MFILRQQENVQQTGKGISFRKYRKALFYIGNIF